MSDEVEPKQRPLDVLHVFSSFAVGGAQVRFAALANHFGDAVRHRIVAMDGNRDARVLLNPELNVLFPKVGLLRHDTLGNFTRIRRYMDLYPPDVLITSNWGSIDWAIARRRNGPRHVHMEDGFGPDERDRQLFRRVLTRWVVLDKSQIILPSRTVELIARKKWRLPAGNLHYIPNGVDAARFAAAKPAVLPQGGEGPVFGTVTALRAEKNLPRLLEAFAIVRKAMPARLVIVGDGPLRAKLKTRAAKLGISGSVHFAGPSAAPEKYYACFDVFVLSSDTEQMPLCVLEAGAAGLPVAATDVGDMRVIVAPENAPYLVARDTAKLAEAMLALIKDPDAARRIGAANRALVARDFTQDAMFEKHWALWRGPQNDEDDE